MILGTQAGHSDDYLVEARPFSKLYPYNPRKPQNEDPYPPRNTSGAGDCEQFRFDMTRDQIDSQQMQLAQVTTCTPYLQTNPAQLHCPPKTTPRAAREDLAAQTSGPFR